MKGAQQSPLYAIDAIQVYPVRLASWPSPPPFMTWSRVQPMASTKPRRRYAVLASTLGAMASLACPLADAERVYKYRMPDGKVVYSDEPVPGGRLEAEMEPPPQPGPSAAPAPRSEPSDVDKRIAARRDALERARRELDAANAALAEAQRRLDAGREPLPQEFKSLAGGGTRVSEEYERRQAANERAVAEAKARARRAADEVNRLRY